MQRYEYPTSAARQLGDYGAEREDVDTSADGRQHDSVTATGRGVHKRSHLVTGVNGYYLSIQNHGRLFSFGLFTEEGVFFPLCDGEPVEEYGGEIYIPAQCAEEAYREWLETKRRAVNFTE